MNSGKAQSGRIFAAASLSPPAATERQRGELEGERVMVRGWPAAPNVDFMNGGPVIPPPRPSLPRGEGELAGNPVVVLPFV